MCSSQQLYATTTTTTVKAFVNFIFIGWSSSPAANAPLSYVTNNMPFYMELSQDPSHTLAFAPVALIAEFFRFPVFFSFPLLVFFFYSSFCSVRRRDLQPLDYLDLALCTRMLTRGNCNVWHSRAQRHYRANSACHSRRSRGLVLPIFLFFQTRNRLICRVYLNVTINDL